MRISSGKLNVETLSLGGQSQINAHHFIFLMTDKVKTTTEEILYKMLFSENATLEIHFLHLLMC